MAWNFLVHNGVLQLHDPGPAVTFLRSQPSGVYTTTRSVNSGSCLLLWDRHLARLAHSVRLLSMELPQFFPNQFAGVTDLNDSLKSILQPSLVVGLQRAMEVRQNEEDFILTAYVCGSTWTEERKGLDTYVHISRYMSDPVGSVTNAAHLAVMGSGRTIPNAKHSQWVRTRQVLEQSRPADMTEIILSDDGDALLEGMVTNFFVVCSGRPDSVAKAKQDSIEGDMKKRWEGFVVQTAPLEGVLPGVIRQLILEICAEQGIPLHEVAPTWTNRHVWKEAFITNSVRLVQSVGSIQIPTEWESRRLSQNWQKNSWEWLDLKAPGHVTQAIQEFVSQRSLMESVPIGKLLIGDE